MRTALRVAARRSRPLFSSPWFLPSRSSSSELPPPPETLAYEEIRSAAKPYTSTALVLHGLLGSGRNWRAFSRRLAAELHKRSPSDEWRMVLVDLRNHGSSFGVKGLNPPHDMANAARDLANLMRSRGWAWPDVIIGHSMGGKVALDFAASCARGDYGGSVLLPKQLWVLDSVPGEVSSGDGGNEVENVLETLKGLPASLPSRKWVVDHMMSRGFSKPLAEWIGSNLKQVGDQVTWTFDLDAAVEMFNSYREQSYWSLLEQPPEGLEIAMVRAENSDRWHPNVLRKLENLSRKEKSSSQEGRVSLHVLPKSGHWVHVDNPQGLLEIMASNFISRA